MITRATKARRWERRRALAQGGAKWYPVGYRRKPVSTKITSVAHVTGTTVPGFFIAEQAAHFLLDIGFIWTIYLDGAMGLVPQSVAMSELDLDDDARAELEASAQLLDEEGRDALGLKRFTPSPIDCLIREVSFYADEERLRILVTGEEGSLAVETSLATGELHVHTSFEQKMDAA